MPIWARSGSVALSAHSMPDAIMNAKTARSQLIGGIVYGLGMALLEETHVDGETGRIVNANIADYLVPVNADVPDIQTIIVAERRTDLEPAGRQGHRRAADGRRRRRGSERRVSRDRRSGAKGADQDRGSSCVAEPWAASSVAAVSSCHYERSEAISIPVSPAMGISRVPPGSPAPAETRITFIVMAGLVPAIGRGTLPLRMAGTSPAMTVKAGCRHDG